jgi:hypothetical protein
MPYGLDPRAPAPSDVVQRALDRASGTWGGYQAWRQLDPASRLDLVERALNPASGCNDDCTLAV